MTAPDRVDPWFDRPMRRLINRERITVTLIVKRHDEHIPKLAARAHLTVGDIELGTEVLLNKLLRDLKPTYQAVEEEPSEPYFQSPKDSVDWKRKYELLRDSYDAACKRLERKNEELRRDKEALVKEMAEDPWHKDRISISDKHWKIFRTCAVCKIRKWFK